MDILVPTDSKASLLAIKKSAGSGKGRTKDLVEVMNKVGRRSHVGLSTQFGWVKSHVGIEENEPADRMVKPGYGESLLPQITEGGVRARWKDLSGKEGWYVGCVPGGSYAKVGGLS